MTPPMETVSFKASAEFSAWLSRAVADLDMSRSEVVRTCIILALPAIQENPGLVEILTISRRSGNGHHGDTSRTQ